jgi:hypothetical protein
VAGGLALLPAAVVILVRHDGIPAGRGDLGALDLFVLLLFGVLALLVALWAYYACWAAMIHAVDRVRTGSRPQVGASLRAGLPFAGRLLGTLLLVGLACLLAFAVGFAGIIGAGVWFGVPTPVASALIGLPAFAVLLWIALRFSAVPQVVVFEGQTGVPALSRSGALMRGQMLRVGGLYLLLLVLFVALSAAVQSGAGSSPVLGSLLSLAVQLVMQVYGVALAVAIYSDLLVRQGERVAGDPVTIPASTTL